MHSGTGGTAWGLQFNGHIILTSILDEMDELYGMQDASEIIVSGASAGGLGVWMNIAGFYYPAVFYTGPEALTWDPDTAPAGVTDFREDNLAVMYDLWDSYVDIDCQEAYIDIDLDTSIGNTTTATTATATTTATAAPCLFANYSYEYISTPIFIVQSLSDEVVLQYHDMMPNVPEQDQNAIPSEEHSFLITWSENMTNALTQTDRHIHGIFAPSCWIHTGFSYQSPKIDGLNWILAFNEYYNDIINTNSTTNNDHIDQCGDEILCNENCPDKVSR